MHKQIKVLLMAAFVLLHLGTVHAGLISVSNNPTSESIPGITNSANNYIFISITNAISNGVSFSTTITETNGSVTGYAWAFQNGTPATSSAESPGTVLFPTITYGQDDICTVALNHQVGSNTMCTTITSVITNTNVTPHTYTTNTNNLLTFNVEVPVISPDTNPVQCGVIGDVVPSIVTTGTPQLHFVAPKGSGNVVLVASAPGVTSSNFSSLLNWDPSVGNAVSGSSNKWEVSTATPGQYVVKLRRNCDNGEVGRYNVWVVWSTISSIPTPISTTISSTQTLVSAGYNFFHIIAPSTIFNTETTTG